MNVSCGYSFEAPPQDASNEYPQLMFLWRNKKIFIFLSLLFNAMYGVACSLLDPFGIFEN